MKTLTLSEAKAKLNELVDEAIKTHERITITRYGQPAVVVLSVDDLEAIEETLFWDAQDSITPDVQAGRSEYENNKLSGETKIRKQFGIGKPT